MILRRLAAAFRQQDWFTVAIEIMIVVLGVFIGIQVANWNDAQKEQTLAEDYTQRLRIDLRAELEYAEALIAYYESTLAAGAAAYTGLTQPAQYSDAVVLTNAYRASQFNFYERRRSTFDEIVNAGKLNLIQEPKLRDTAILIYATQMFDVVQEEGQTARFRELFRMTVEPALQHELGRQCGDRYLESLHGAAGVLTLDYPCEFTGTSADIEAAVSSLRGDDNVIRALRLRNVQVAGRIGDLRLTLNALGLTDLFAGREEPE